MAIGQGLKKINSYKHFFFNLKDYISILYDMNGKSPKHVEINILTDTQNKFQSN